MPRRAHLQIPRSGPQLIVLERICQEQYTSAAEKMFQERHFKQDVGRYLTIVGIMFSNALLMGGNTDSATPSQSTPPGTNTAEVRVIIQVDRTLNTMRGGIGASWHAIETAIPYGVKHPIFDAYSHGGSGWGGYPPAEDERAWRQIYRHANWLGLDWNRVEIEQRVYEPEKDRFSFDNPEMRILYRILDWNQKNRADVFFQQMWCNVPWLAYPEFRSDPVARVHSAPADLSAFARGLATLMEHLIVKRKYTCIKWLCINNEPGEGFSWWQAPTNQPLSIGPGLTAVRHALDERGLALPLCGPDMTIGFPPNPPSDYDFLDQLGAYDFHDYGADFDFRTQGHISAQVRNAAAWANFAHGQGKPLFLSEYGTMAYGWLPDKPGPSSPESALAGSELVIRLANAGVDGFNRWSFVNRGDLDGQWQLIDTWDREKKQLLPQITPHPNSYFGLGLLSRFIARNSSVLATQVKGGSWPQDQPWQRVFAAAFRSPLGQYTIAVANDSMVEAPLILSLQGLPKRKSFWRYHYTVAERERTDVRVEPQRSFVANPSAPLLHDTLPGNSLTLYSTYKLSHSDPGITQE